LQQPEGLGGLSRKAHVARTYKKTSEVVSYSGRNAFTGEARRNTCAALRLVQVSGSVDQNERKE
jgi:hypothetical protein